MWRILIKIISFLVALLLITSLHVFFVSIVSVPLSYIHIIVVSIIVYLFVFENGSVVWLGFLLFFALDSYSAGTPFGILLFSGTMATLCAYWCYQNIFTNHSWFAAFALTAFFLIFFRSYYILIRFFLNMVFGVPFDLVHIFGILFWELGLTAIASGIIIAVFNRLLPMLRLKSRKELFNISRRGL